MSTKLPSSPTPQKFADTLIREVIAPAVRRMGGDTGIVTPKKAAQAKLSPKQELARDNVRNYFELGDKKRASAETLIGAAHDYAKSQAEKAAGKDGRLSQADAKKLREDLQADFVFLRAGKLPPKASDDFTFKKLSASTQLGELVENVNTTLRDNNTSTGKVEVTAYSVSDGSTQGAIALAKELLTKAERAAQILYATPDKVEQSAKSQAQTNAMHEVISWQGMFYSPENDEDRHTVMMFLEDINGMVKNEQVVHASTEGYSPTYDTGVPVHVYVLANEKAKEAVAWVVVGHDSVTWPAPT